MTPIKVVSCEVLKPLFERMRGDIPAEYLRQGLHDVPAKLRAELQQKLDEIEQPSIIIIGYGLCGNGLEGLKAGKHWLVVPRAHDCIPLIIGSYERYMEEFNSQPGTYYLSPGWLASGTDPLCKHQEYVEKYGEETAEWLSHETIKNYKRLVFVVSEPEDVAEWGERARQVAEYFQVEFETMTGSDGYIVRLVERIEHLEETDRDFLIIPPGSELKQADFFR